ncbi:MAG: hypothetical protein BA862_05145 [Desulfobulbaceae bacterium S3730MH12]|nr:MAG: hypothetical protein BA862_05145 [Desulfobulbaceae bacterium S3730MH12]OEU83880.1 MAG: hypothetical protein BA873_15410 [Desulfobulbaceae bacterium C00003063]
MDHSFAAQIWPQLIWPLIRITFFISIGLIIANCIESLNWTHRLSTLARPLIRMGRLSTITGASFSVAFFSGVSANSMLAEAYDAEKINKTELVLANLFNSLPRFFLHLPTVFFLTAPLIKGAAILYVGLTLAAAIVQTFFVVLLGRLTLPPNSEPVIIQPVDKIKQKWREVIIKSLKRLKKRMGKLLKFMVPVYVLFFILNWYGLFTQFEELIAEKAWFLSWLNPQSLGIVILHVTAEFSAGLAAASVLLAENSLTYREVVLALLVGNILAAPIRAIRHQFPYYTGIYSPGLALQLVTISQLVRAFCVIGVAVCYFFLTR